MVNSSSFTVEALDQVEPGIDESPPVDPATLRACFLYSVLHLQVLLLNGCGWMKQGAVEIVGAHPVDAGGFADIWIGIMGDRTVAIKSHRCYLSSDNLPAHVVSDIYLRRTPLTGCLFAEVLQRGTGV
jgi:hypothetical protein